MAYQAATVCKVVDISDKLLNQWLHRKHIKPERLAHGPGTRNEYGEANICQIQLFKWLATYFKLKEASKIAFDERVKKEFERQVKAAKTQNCLLRATTPVVLLISMRGFDGKIRAFFAEDGEQLGGLFRQMVKSEVTTTVNLTEIAFQVTGVLDKP